MRLTALQKPERLEFTDPENPEAPASQRPYLLVRCADIEARAKLKVVGEPEAAKLGLTGIGEMKMADYDPINAVSSVGTQLTGWGNWEDDEGNPLPDRDASGKLIIENGVTILMNQDVYDAFVVKLITMRKAQSDRIVAIAKNSEPPSVVS